MGRPVLLAFALAALIVATFAGVTSANFVNYDDPDYVTENPHVRAGLTAHGIGWAASTMFAANWHPLTWLSHMLDVQLFDLAPESHHLMSVLFHALATLLLFAGLSRLADGTSAAMYRAAAVAALFAVHPLHVESVAWISERKDVLSTAFWMATLLAYAAYARQPRRGRYLIVAALFAAGLTAKPMLVTMPFVLLLLDVWPLDRWKDGTRRSLIVEKLPLLALSLISSVVTVIAQQSAGALRNSVAISLADRLANAAVSYWMYLLKTIWPVNLAAFYPYAGSYSPALPIAAVAGLVAVSIAALTLRRRAPWLFVGWFWYVGTLVPVIGIVQVGNQAMADRYTYVPLVGIFIAMAWGVPALLQRWRRIRIAAPGAALTAIVVLIPAARAQTSTWRDSETLWRHAIAVTRDNYFAHGALGAALAARGATAEAEREFAEALRLKPDQADVHNDLGSLLARRGSIDEALPHFRQAVALDPHFAEARHNLGMALWARGSTAEAIALLNDALRINPDLPRTHNDLGRILATSGKVPEALLHFLESVRLAPDSVETRYNAALALSQLGRSDEARRQLQAALAIDPVHRPSLDLLKQLGG